MDNPGFEPGTLCLQSSCSTVGASRPGPAVTLQRSDLEEDSNRLSTFFLRTTIRLRACTHSLAKRSQIDPTIGKSAMHVTPTLYPIRSSVTGSQHLLCRSARPPCDLYLCLHTGDASLSSMRAAWSMPVHDSTHHPLTGEEVGSASHEENLDKQPSVGK